MKVKCVKSGKSAQTILNKIYLCTRVYSNAGYWMDDGILRSKNPTWKVRIHGLSSSFPIENFTLEDGTEIPKVDTTHSVGNSFPKWINTESMEEGRIIVCNAKHLKTLTYGKYYHIDKIAKKGYTTKFTIKELDNNRYYSPYNFRLIPTDKLRELEIDNLLGESKEIEEKTTNYNELDHLNNIEKIEIIAGSLMDAINYKKQTRIEDTSLFEIIKQRKIGKSSLKEEDFDMLDSLEWDKFLHEK